MQKRYLKVFLILLVYYGAAAIQASAQDNLRNQIPVENTFTGVPSWSDIVTPRVVSSPNPDLAQSLRISNNVDEPPQVAGSDNEKRKVEIVDLGKMADNIMSTDSDKYDYSVTIGSSKIASVHLHALGFSQTTPLHLHHNSEEATIIVTGKPHVTQFFGHNGTVEKLEGDYSPGTLIYSPRLCGHKWVNTSKKTMQANLVISSPLFLGNFYVDPTEPLFKTSGQALVIRPNEDLQRWLRVSQGPVQAEKLPMMNGRMLRLLLRKQIHLQPSSSVTILYVIGGNGLIVADQSYPLQAKNLALIPPHYAITLEASQNAPLVAIVFRPEAEWEPLPTE